MRKHGGLEIDQDLDFQRLEWRIQRIGWIVMLLIVVAALTGAFGKGPLAHTRATASDGSFTIEYDRLVRHSSATTLTFNIARPPHDTIGIWFESQYINGIDVEDIIPSPIRTASGDGTITYYFEARAGATITIEYEPDDVGRRRTRAGIENGASMHVRQFVFP